MSKVRVASVEDKVKILIDRGAEIDQEIKNLKQEDGVIKETLSEVALNIFEEDEKSVTLEGKGADAMVQKKVSYGIEFANELDKAEFIKKVTDGEYRDVVEVGVKVDVNPARIGKLLELLKSEGYDASFDFKLNKKGYENEVKVEGEGSETLKKVVKIGSSTAVKYTWK